MKNYSRKAFTHGFIKKIEMLKKDDFFSISRKAFTLIEVIVATAILSIVMVSIFTVFAVQADLNSKLDISRSIEENIKFITDKISEDVRTNGIKICTTDTESNCNHKTQTGTKLYINQAVVYSLKYDNGVNFATVSDINDCKVNECKLFRGDDRLSNSSVNISNLSFLVDDNGMPKVRVNASFSYSSKKGVRKDIIEKTKLDLQTTFSTRFYNAY